MDFFSILLPGALLTFLLRETVKADDTGTPCRVFFSADASKAKLFHAGTPCETEAAAQDKKGRRTTLIVASFCSPHHVLSHLLIQFESQTIRPYPGPFLM